MNTHYLDKLEFNKVLENLSKYCSSDLGKELAMQLTIYHDANIVKQKLAETEEAVNLVFRNSLPSFYNICDIHNYILRLESSQTLTIKGLLDLNTIFVCAKNLKSYFAKDYIDTNDFPILEAHFSNLYSNEGVINKITSSIIDENTLDDKASPELQRIRKKIRNLEQDIRSKLNDMIHSSSFSKYIQENVITIRNGRFVIPIKEEYRYINNVSDPNTENIIYVIIRNKRYEYNKYSADE